MLFESTKHEIGHHICNALNAITLTAESDLDGNERRTVKVESNRILRTLIDFGIIHDRPLLDEG